MKLNEIKEEIIKLFETEEQPPEKEEVVKKETDIKTEVVFKSTDHELRIVYGVVLEPGTFDAQGDITTEDEIFKAMHNYMLKHQTINIQHTPTEVDSVIIENFIAPTDMMIGDEQVVKGAWVMGVKVLNDQVWEAVEKGIFTGYSIEGRGMRTPIEE